MKRSRDQALIPVFHEEEYYYTSVHYNTKTSEVVFQTGIDVTRIPLERLRLFSPYFKNMSDEFFTTSLEGRLAIDSGIFGIFINIVHPDTLAIIAECLEEFSQDRFDYMRFQTPKADAFSSQDTSIHANHFMAICRVLLLADYWLIDPVVEVCQLYLSMALTYLRDDYHGRYSLARRMMLSLYNEIPSNIRDSIDGMNKAATCILSAWNTSLPFEEFIHNGILKNNGMRLALSQSITRSTKYSYLLAKALLHDKINLVNLEDSLRVISGEHVNYDLALLIVTDKRTKFDQQHFAVAAGQGHLKIISVMLDDDKRIAALRYDDSAVEQAAWKGQLLMIDLLCTHRNYIAISDDFYYKALFFKNEPEYKEVFERIIYYYNQQKEARERNSPIQVFKKPLSCSLCRVYED
jgi:hypothetical protein